MLMGWLTGWLYRKQHVINSATGAGTNYQVKIIAHYGGGTDNAGDVYCDTKCKQDFGDLRFTTSDGVTSLDYWMESKTDNNNAVFWVEVIDDLSSSNVDLYVYYGNSNATSISNGVNTFLKFDSCDSTAIGDLWAGTQGESTIYNGNAFDVTVGAISNQSGGSRTGVLDMKVLRNSLGQTTTHVGGVSEEHYLLPSNLTTAVDFDYYINTLNTPVIFWCVYPFVVFKYTDGTSRMVRLKDSYQSSYEWKYNSYLVGNLTTASPTNTTVLTGDLISTWYSKSIKNLDYDSKTVSDVYLGVGGGYDNNTGYGSVEAYFDNIRIRKYVAPEPCNGTWGIEQNVYTITASADSTATISPTGTVHVGSGENQAYSISATTGYHITHVYVDAIDQGALTSYTFSNVTADHTISVTSAIDTFSITASAGSGGTISPSGTVTVNYNTDQAFTMTADASHQILSVTVDGLAQGDISNYMFNDVQSDHVITVTFTSNGIPSEGITMNGPLSYDLTAAEAISANRIVAMNNDGTIVMATRSNAQHQVGIAVEDINSGNQGAIAFSGPVQVIAGMNLTPGMHVTTDDLGRAYQYASHYHDKGDFEFSTESDHTHVVEHAHTSSVTVDSGSPDTSSENAHTHAITHGSIQVTDGNGDTHSHYYVVSPTQAGSSHTHTVTHAHTGSVSINSESPETTGNSGHTHTITSGHTGTATDEKPMGIVIVGASTGNLATIIL